MHTYTHVTYVHVSNYLQLLPRRHSFSPSFSFILQKYGLSIAFLYLSARKYNNNSQIDVFQVENLFAQAICTKLIFSSLLSYFMKKKRKKRVRVILL